MNVKGQNRDGMQSQDAEDRPVVQGAPTRGCSPREW